MPTGYFAHHQIDDGEGTRKNQSGGIGGTPVLMSGGEFDYELIKKQFIKRSPNIDPELRELVLTKLEEAHSQNVFAKASR